MNTATLNEDLSQLVQLQNGCKYTDIEDGVVSDIHASLGVNFNVLHLNIRSFVRNKDSLIMLLSDLQEHGVVVHAIALCETYLNINNYPLVELENYKPVHKYRSGYPGGGTSLFLHDSVRLSRVVNTPFDANFESVAAEVTFPEKSILVAEFYRPPNTDVAAFMDSLQSFYAVLKGHKTCFVCSDQNLDLLKSSMHQQTSDFLSSMLDNELIPLIWKPTRVTHRTSTLIDNIYAKSRNLMSSNSFVIVDGMSDHFPCLLSYVVKLRKTKGKEVTIQRHKLSESAIQQMQEKLLFHDWTPVDNMSVNDGYGYLIETIMNVLDSVAPKTFVKISNDEKFREP